MDPWYVTREDLMSATDVKASARTAAQLDVDADMASRTAERLLHRVFYPWTGTRYFDWPAHPASRSWRLWLGQYDLTELTAVASNDGSTIALGNVFLNPQDGPPYSMIEIDQSTVSALSSGSTWQRAMGLTGVWGWANSQTPAGTLSASVNASATTVTVSDSSLAGIGSLLTVGSERMLVRGKAQVDTTVDLSADLAVSNGATTVSVSDGSLIGTGETILVGSEYMQVVDKAGDDLTVKRAVSGSVIAAHSSSTAVYAPRALTVDRAVTGTTAAAHTSGDALTVWVPPGPVRNFAQALAVSYAQQRTGGWTKAQSAALDELTQQMRDTYGRFRMETV